MTDSGESKACASCCGAGYIETSRGPVECDCIGEREADGWTAASDMNAEFTRAMDALTWLCFQNEEEIVSGPRGDGLPGPFIDGRFGWTQIPDRIRDLIEVAVSEAEACDVEHERAVFEAQVRPQSGR